MTLITKVLRISSQHLYYIVLTGFKFGFVQRSLKIELLKCYIFLFLQLLAPVYNNTLELWQ